MGKPDHLSDQEARELKRRRLRWIKMIEQLRFGSPSAREIAPGQCQDMLDFLVARYWDYDIADVPPLLRFDRETLSLEKATVAELRELLPDEPWARKERPPHSTDNYPIFLHVNNRLIYLDGRRRINACYNDDPDAIMKYWRINYEI